MTDQDSTALSLGSRQEVGGDTSRSSERTPAQPQPEARATPEPRSLKSRSWRRLAIVAALGVGIAAAFVELGVPWIKNVFSTISTDDGYVNGHATLVAPRVAGQIARVFVDDNNRVHKGDLLAELDTEPYLVTLAEKDAAVDTAEADLRAAMADVRATEAQARGRRWNLQHTVQDVDNQIALLRSRVAAVEKSKAALKVAKLDFDRAQALVARDDVSHQVYDRRQAELTTAQAQLTQSRAEVYQIRASLGLPGQPLADEDLGATPADLDETFSSVLEAQAELIQSAAKLGVLHSFEQGPKAMIEEFEKLGDVSTVFARYAAGAPAVKQAEARLEAAKREVAQAKLALHYCEIFAEIDGVVTRRNVNPGDYVQIGQNLMAVRSLTDVWVDANFKETQLRDLRIGQPVELFVDMYGSKRLFKGRVSGFAEGTGSTLAILPPENATGNFVKVVQRLPVRIDLVDYDPDRTPLFIGSSVVPYVHFEETPTGANAGGFLQSYAASPITPPTGRSALGDEK